jgi:hypothetical protein
MTPLAPVDLPPRLGDQVECFGQAGRVVVERLALAAVLAELPRVALAVAVFVICNSKLVGANNCGRGSLNTYETSGRQPPAGHSIAPS